MIKRCIMAILLTVCIAATAMVVLIPTTQWGLQLGFRVLAHCLPSTLQAETIQGRLLGSMEFSNLHYHQQSFDLFAKHIKLKIKWSSLLHRTLKLQTATAKQILINHFYRIEAWHATGHLQLAAPMDTRLQTELTLDMRGHQPLKASATLSGNITHKMTFNLHTNSPLTLHATFQDLQHDGTLQVTGHWKNLILPLRPNQYLNSQSGHLHITGTLNRYRAQLQTDLAGNDIPNTHLTAFGTGNLQSIVITSLRASLLTGSIKGSLTLYWAPHLKWRTLLQCTHINPGIKWPNWIGELNMRIQSNGEWRPIQPQFYLRIDQVSGQLHQQPIYGYVETRYRQHQLAINNSHLSVGRELFQLNGHLGKTWQVKWLLKAPDITELVAHATGSADSQGHISGNYLSPNIYATLSAQKLWLAGLHVGKLRSKVNLHIHPQGTLKATIFGQSIQFHQYNAQKIQLNASGTVEKHKLNGLIQIDNTVVSTQLNGTYLNHTWHGIFQGKTITGNATWQADNHWATHIKIQHLPTQPFNMLLPAGLILQTKMDASINLKQMPQQALEGHVHLNTTKGTIRDSNIPQSIIAFDDIWLQATADHTGISAHAQIHAHQQAILDAAIQLPKYRAWQPFSPTQSIVGQIQLNLSHLNMLAIFIPDIRATHGTLRTNLRIKGKLNNPVVNGNLAIENGVLQILPIGITLNNIQIHAKNTLTHQIAFSGTANSGTGQCQIKGSTSLKNWTFPSTIHLAGQHVTVMDTDEYHIEASPDLTLQYDAPKLSLTGNVVVQKATLQPQHFTQVVTLPSNTIIIYGLGNIYEVAATRFYMQLKIELSQDVELAMEGLAGKLNGTLNIHLSPNQLTTAIGQLSVQQGQYSAYGATLNIDTGELIYTGGPLDNPGLNIHVSKQVQHYMTIGNTGGKKARLSSSLQNVTVGINIGGTMNHPKINLFSNPSGLKDADILSYLLLDAPSNQASSVQGKLLLNAAQHLGLNRNFNIISDIQNTFGFSELGIETSSALNLDGDDKPSENASLIIGKQITPKLHLSYSVGLLNPINILRLRYQLSRLWSLQSETSTLGNGADLFYSIETN